MFMPTYDYICNECNITFDKILKISDRELPTKEPCPNCSQSDTIELCITAPSLMSPFRVDGLKKPTGQFRDRMQQIKSGIGKARHNLKDY